MSVSALGRSNLERFIHGVTPNVPSQTLSKSCIHDLNKLWQPIDRDTIEYFTLGDLWNCYDECSAYGLGIPLLSDNCEKIVQYYVPYLSALQIYTNKSFACFRNSSDDSDAVEFESDSWSDDSESDKMSRSFSNNSSKTWDANSDDSSFDHEGLWPMRDRLGYLYFQYYETCSPYWRMPLMDKINELSRDHLGLTTFRSVDLSPASWMAVAWYPIYHIPSGRNVKDLATCFLTYHTLSSSFQDTELEDGVEDTQKEVGCCEAFKGVETVGGKCEGNCRGIGISLPPFGLVSYKMPRGDLWLKPDTSDYERFMYLHCAADSWLKQLGVQHHDFNFFASHSAI